jgi:murein DD-endopeptidase MepM/ murein hydrolase activator NlpD
MRKKVLVLGLIVALVMCLSPFSFATSSQDKLKSVENQKDDISSDLSSLSSEIKTQQAAISTLQKSINSKASEIKKAQAKLNDTKNKIADRKDGLEKRLRAMYKNGSVGYIDIILSSQNVTDLVSNIEMVQKIYTNDQTILGTLKTQKKQIETQQAKLTAQKKVLDSKQAKLTQKKAAMQSAQSKLTAKLNSLKSTENKLRAQIAASSGSNGGSYGGGMFCWPSTSHIITSQFGEARSYESHPGIDIGASYGSPVYAAASGTVVIAGWYGGYGKCIGINHGGGLTTIYGHNSSLSVSVGQHVSKGQVISHVGSTGWSTGPHLHFEVRKNGTPVSPWPYFK